MGNREKELMNALLGWNSEVQVSLIPQELGSKATHSSGR